MIVTKETLIKNVDGWSISKILIWQWKMVVGENVYSTGALQHMTGV